MSSSRLLSLGLLLFLAACAPENRDTTISRVYDPCLPVALSPTPPVSEAELASVREALGWWNQAAGTRFTLEADADPVPLRFEVAAPFVHGLYDDEAGVVYINHALEDDHARAVVVAHELGHVMGLEHVPLDAGPSLMNPGNTRVGLQPADLDRLRDLWGICAPAGPPDA